MRAQRGFSLPMLLLTATLGTTILLAALKIFSHLSYQLSLNYQRYQLAHTLQQLMDKIAKDLARAGFMYPVHAVPVLPRKQPLFFPLRAPVIIGHYPSEAPASCLLLYHDRNRQGFTKKRGAYQPAETVGYRLRQSNLETQHGITACHGSHWEDLLDERTITVQQFHVLRAPGEPWVALILSASLPRHPTITSTLRAVVIVENLS